MNIYLDNAATTALREEVIEAMLPYMREHHGNPSSIHAQGRITKTAIERSRKCMTDRLNTSPSELFFTSCGTESNNMILRRSVQDLGVKHIITSPIEHHCITHTVTALEADFGTQVHWAEVDSKGRTDLNWLGETLKNLNGKETLVSLMYANNELGNLLDIEKVGEICGEHGAWFHSDTVQAAGHYDIDLQKINVHFISGSAHKIHGPKGAGFVYIKNEASLKPMLYGGTQERNMRAGTENIYGIVGLGKAFEIAIDQLTEEKAYIGSLKAHLKNKILTEIPGAYINGEEVDELSLYTVLNVGFPAHKANDLLLFNLDIAGICASSGSACSSGAETQSHVLEAIGADPTHAAVRFSFSSFNTIAELDYLVDKLKELYKTKATLNQVV